MCCSSLTRHGNLMSLLKKGTPAAVKWEVIKAQIIFFANYSYL